METDNTEANEALTRHLGQNFVFLDSFADYKRGFFDGYEAAKQTGQPVECVGCKTGTLTNHTCPIDKSGCNVAFERWAEQELLVIDDQMEPEDPLYYPNHGAWCAFRAGWEARKSIEQEAQQPVDCAEAFEVAKRGLKMPLYSVEPNPFVRSHIDCESFAREWFAKGWMARPEREAEQPKCPHCGKPCGIRAE